jgi:hypothetical protein
LIDGSPNLTINSQISQSRVLSHKTFSGAYFKKNAVS